MMADVATVPAVPVPVRVVVDREGLATSPRRAGEIYGISPDYLFVRNDGWVLGAPAHLRDVARGLWRTAWIEAWRRDGDRWVRTWPLPE